MFRISKASGIYESIISVLETNRRALDIEALKRAVSWLSDARQILARDGRRFDHLRSGNSVSPVSPRSAGSQPERWSAGTHDELGGDAAGCGDRAVSGRLYPGNHRERGDCQPVRREGYCDYPAGTPLAEQADLVLPLLVRENDYIFKPSTSRYAMLAMVDVLATELAMANKPRKRQITPY